jgi:RNA polymerase sigma-70 factor (ECF subfamily)
MMKAESLNVLHEIAANLIARDWGRLLAALIHYFGDFDLAEDALQDAVETALNTWSSSSIPERPDAWLLQVARRKGLNAIKRSKTFDRKKTELVDMTESDRRPHGDETTEFGSEIPDERLQLMFMCCHPALSLEASVALTLRALGGLSTAEIARAFIVPESTMAQRLVRVKRKIRAAGIPFDVPVAARWQDRLEAVMHVVYFIFNEGYAASSGEALTRGDLCEEALFLGRMLVEIAPDEPEAAGLLALMLFHDARRCARTDENGDILMLEDQDRSLWKNDTILEGDRVLRNALARNEIGPYQLQAAIAGIHAQSETFEQTDWHEILLLYDVLCDIQPSSVFRLNRAVALSFANGPVDGLAAIADLEEELGSYLPFHAARGDFLRRLGRHEEAVDAYVKAVRLAGNEAERRFFRRRLAGY